ncbi:MAG: hypothetical protein ACRDT6_00915 [Micromonosporaceae bacterium]
MTDDLVRDAAGNAQVAAYFVLSGLVGLGGVDRRLLYSSGIPGLGDMEYARAVLDIAGPILASVDTDLVNRLTSALDDVDAGRTSAAVTALMDVLDDLAGLSGDRYPLPTPAVEPPEII